MKQLHFPIFENKKKAVGFALWDLTRCPLDEIDKFFQCPIENDVPN